MSAIILSQYLTKCHHRNSDSQLKIFLMKNIDETSIYQKYIQKQLFPFLEPTLQQQALHGLKMLSRMMVNTYYSGFFMKTCKLCQSNCGDKCLRQIGFISVQQNHRTSSQKGEKLLILDCTVHNIATQFHKFSNKQLIGLSIEIRFVKLCCEYHLQWQTVIGWNTSRRTNWSDQMVATW